MNLTFQQFKGIVTLLKTEQIFRNEYLETVPSDLQLAVVDNFYTNSLGVIGDRLADLLFDEYAEDVSWLLYECDYDRISHITVDSRDYIINSLEAYFDYAEKEMKFLT